MVHSGYKRIQMHTQNKQYSLLFHYNNGCRDVPQCYVVCTLPVLLRLRSFGGVIKCTLADRYLQTQL